MRHKWKAIEEQKKNLIKIDKDMQKVEEDAKSIKDSASKILELFRGL